MRVALYRPHGAKTDAAPFDGNDPAHLVEAALTACGHDVVRVPVRSPDESGIPTSGEADEIDSAEAAYLIEYFRSARGPTPEIWISSLVSARAPDRIGAAASAALGIPYVLVQPSIPAAGSADADMQRLHRTIAAADATIVFSSAKAQSLRQVVPQCGNRLIALPPLIDVDRVATVVRQRATLRATMALQHQISVNVPWLIVAGPMSTDAHLVSLRAVARAAILASTLDWQLIVVGTGSRGSDVRSLFRCLPRRSDRHVIVAKPEDVTVVLACGDLFLCPFADDASSLTALEAQAAGIGVVAAHSPAMLDIVAGGKTGMLTKPNNEASFANAVTFLLRQPDFRRSFAQNSLKWVRANFDMPVVARQLSDAIGRINEDFGSHRPPTPA